MSESEIHPEGQNIILIAMATVLREGAVNSNTVINKLDLCTYVYIHVRRYIWMYIIVEQIYDTI